MEYSEEIKPTRLHLIGIFLKGDLLSWIKVDGVEKQLPRGLGMTKEGYQSHITYCLNILLVFFNAITFFSKSWMFL